MGTSPQISHRDEAATTSAAVPIVSGVYPFGVRFLTWHLWQPAHDCCELQDEGLAIGRRRTARLMGENGLKARQKRRFKRTTDSHHDLPIAPNLLCQDFTTERPDEKWGADISYVWTREGWLYLAVVIDLFARRVVGKANVYLM
jgi:hypothetical protein